MAAAQELYPIIEVDHNSAIDVEQLGSKRKFWFRPDASTETRQLFKADDRVAGGSTSPGTGEDWAEKICCELCQHLGIPHVRYDLAVETSTGVPGVVCDNIAPGPPDLILGNVLLSEIDPSYLADAESQYQDNQQTVQAVIQTLARLEPPPSEFCDLLPPGIESASDVFVGYMMLDALVANQDRHHQNWGALRHAGRSQLAPTFDHGAALARNVPDAKRQRLLEEKDSRATMATFATKAKSGFVEHLHAVKPLRTVDAFDRFAENHPGTARLWLSRLRSLSVETVDSIIQRIPENRMSPLARAFTLRLIRVNQDRLMTR